MALLLVSQLLGQAVALKDQGVVLSFLGAKGGLRLTELPPQVGIGSCKHEDKGKINKGKSSRKIRPGCSAVGPNLGDYTQWVR